MDFSPKSLDRRAFLKAGAAAGVAAVLPGTSAAVAPLAPTAKSCIFLMLTGGPSQLDTWDPKPDAPSNVRSPFRPIPTRVPGVHVTELFPKLAAVADKVAFVRTLHHTAAPIHENGFQLLNTGRLFRDGPEWPSVGCVVSRLTGPQSQARSWWVLPTSEVSTGVAVSHGQGAGHFAGPDARPAQFRAGNPSVPPHFRFEVTAATAGIAVEDGARFVTVNMYPTVFDAPSWDCHADGGSLACDLGDYRDTVAPAFDAAFATLLTDLEDRGLLDTTLVVAVGEFGRTPKRNANGGRDHWAGCWTALLAGGGVQGGRVIGSSDATAAEPKDCPVTCPELVATVYHALGIPAATPIPGPDGRPVPVVEAEPVRELF